MKKITFFAVFFLMAVIAYSQKVVNDANAEVRQVTGFHAIKASHGISVLISQGNNEAVAVSAASDEFRSRIKTVVENGILKISYDQNFLKELRGKDKKLKAYVSVVNLDHLDGSSGAYFSVDGELKSNTLEIEASSGAGFGGKVNVNQLSIDQSSGSIINISGSANNADIEGSSGSLFNGYDLATNNCDAETSSGSNVQITVNKELIVQASSGGNISYKGSGVIKSVKTSSGGNVSKKG